MNLVKSFHQNSSLQHLLSHKSIRPVFLHCWLVILSALQQILLSLSYMLVEFFMFQDLIYLCLDYMCNHIAQAFVHNQLISWFQYTLSLGHYQVALVSIQNKSIFLRFLPIGRPLKIYISPKST